MAPSMRYLVVRALLFLVPFIVLMIAQVPWWLSLIVSLAFAFAASIVFFSKLRDAAAADLQRMREGRKRDGAGPDDADVEDAAIGDAADEQPARERERGDAGEQGEAAEQGDAAEPSANGTESADDPDASARP